MPGIDEAFELPPAVAHWLNEYRRLQYELKQLQEKMEIARAHVELAMGDNLLGTVNGQPVIKWGWQESRRFDQKKAQELLGEQLASECYTIQKSRPFRILSPDDEI